MSAPYLPTQPNCQCAWGLIRLQTSEPGRKPLPSKPLQIPESEQLVVVGWLHFPDLEERTVGYWDAQKLKTTQYFWKRYPFSTTWPKHRVNFNPESGGIYRFM